MMMMSRYDEDLYDNPFFVALEKQHQSLYDEATANRWIICIPKFSTINNESLVKQDFEDHILIPLSENEAAYKTVSKHDVTVHQGLIELGSGFEEKKQVEILFEETFYNNKDESYRVLCVASFFNRQTQVETGSASESAVSKAPGKYEDCLRILWGHSGSAKTKDSLDKALLVFCTSYQRLEEESLSSLVDLVSTQVTRAMQIVLKDQNIRQTVKEKEMYMGNLKIAVEMYMMNAIHKHLFSTITACVKSADAVVNKMTRNLVDLRLHHLGVRKEFEENLPAAKMEIAKLNQYSTPLGRLFCLRRVVTALTKSHADEGLQMTSDDFLPLLIYLIVRSQIPNWTANLMYMKHFQQARVQEYDEFSFYLATTEAALDYISGGNIKIDNSQSSPQKLSKPVAVGSTDVSGLKRQGSGGTSSTKDKFFQYVQYGDETAVCMMLKKPKSSNDVVISQLCHPLCTCDKCSEIVARNKNNSGAVSILARDDMGRTALHIAAYYGQATLIDILVKNGALSDATDFLGCTPLHMACQKGFQNIILLLVHFGSDISAYDNEGNTPLHLCAKNGHEDCVKAILFLDILKNRLNVNSQNDMGDTPLHLAAKWGYEGIVRFLLESEADPRIRNRKRQTPLNFAQNPTIKRELEAAFTEQPPVIYNHPAKSAPPTSSLPPAANPKPPNTLPGVPATDLEDKHPMGFEIVDVKPPIPMIDNSSSEMMSPNTPVVASLDQVDMHQIERLFKAIKSKDIQLIKFYLGWVESPDEDDSPQSPSAGATLCHPLCQCDKCQGLQKKFSRSNLHVNCQNKKGFSPLHIAVIENNMEAFTLFLKQGAKVNMKTINSITPLHLACYHSNMQMVQQLVERGAEVNCADNHGEIPLHLACSKSYNSHIVLYLIQHSSIVNLANVNGNTALHHAASLNSLETARILLDNGAEPDVPNKHHQTPSSLTKIPEIQKLLEEARQKAASREKTASPETMSEQEHRILKLKGMIASLGEKDLRSLQELGTSIQSFDKHQSLKRSKTFDHSSPVLDSPNLKLSLSIRNFDREKSLKRSQTLDKTSNVLNTLKHSLSIQHFDTGSLKHVLPVDKSSPMHIMSLTRSFSCYRNYSDDPSGEIAEVISPENASEKIVEIIDSDKTSENASDKKGEDTDSDKTRELTDVDIIAESSEENSEVEKNGFESSFKEKCKNTTVTTSVKAETPNFVFEDKSLDINTYVEGAISETSIEICDMLTDGDKIDSPATDMVGKSNLCEESSHTGQGEAETELNMECAVVPEIAEQRASIDEVISDAHGVNVQTSSEDISERVLDSCNEDRGCRQIESEDNNINLETSNISDFVDERDNMCSTESAIQEDNESEHVDDDRRLTN